MPYTSPNQRRYIEFVATHPGCSIADVNRACKLNPRAGHKWVYDGVSRLLKRGLLTNRSRKGAYALYVPEAK